MALTEQDRQDQEKDEMQRKVVFNLEIIVAAAKYERIVGNKDFLAIQEDIKNVKLVLDQEILMLSTQLATEEDALKRANVQTDILTKSIRRLVVMEGMTYPERIIRESEMAKEENVELRKQLKEKFNVEA